MTWKAMGHRLLFRSWPVRLQAILSEEFIDLGYLYVFKLYFVCLLL